MRARIILVATLLLSPVVVAHEVTPSSLLLYVGQANGEIRVVDHSGCSAQISASVDDPAIASVSPASVSGSDVKFAVTPLNGGTTKVTIHWAGEGPGCNDVGSTKVDLVVKSGPDLQVIAILFGQQLQRDSLGRRRYPCREGDRRELRFEIFNGGNEQASGFVTITTAIPPQLRTRPLPDHCESSGSTVECTTQLNPPIPPGESRQPTDVYIPFVCFAEGFASMNMQITGLDVDTGNNAHRLDVEVEPARAGGALPTPTPAPSGGRRGN